MPISTSIFGYHKKKTIEKAVEKGNRKELNWTRNTRKLLNESMEIRNQKGLLASTS